MTAVVEKEISAATMAKMGIVLPCPFCGSTNLDTSAPHYVLCNACGGEGPVSDIDINPGLTGIKNIEVIKQDSLRLWNTRK